MTTKILSVVFALFALFVSVRGQFLRDADSFEDYDIAGTEFANKFLTPNSWINEKWTNNELPISAVGKYHRYLLSGLSSEVPLGGVGSWRDVPVSSWAQPISLPLLSKFEKLAMLNELPVSSKFSGVALQEPITRFGFGGFGLNNNKLDKLKWALAAQQQDLPVFANKWSGLNKYGISEPVLGQVGRGGWGGGFGRGGFGGWGRGLGQGLGLGFGADLALGMGGYGMYGMSPYGMPGMYGMGMGMNPWSMYGYGY